MWVGIECTTNRVGDVRFDQLQRSGHYDRIESDVHALADLGVRAIRYPVLWERHDSDDAGVWACTDRALNAMRARGVEPIVGLVHHGSGPRRTRIDDPSFADGLSGFARTVARRYPWIRRYTPINEPLTTARFSLLYGLWYPHLRDDRAFIRGMLVQSQATMRAMAAIREVRTDAELVQTEDLGHTHTTAPLAYQGAFENARRWLTVDFLVGRVDEKHPLWRYLARLRGAHDIARALADRPCPPSIVGLNHYITSERFLDHRVARYPAHTIGGNGRHRYADVEAIRALRGGVLGPRRLLREAFERYRLPIAVTEAHLGCSREQQLCWLGDLVNAAHALSRDGIDLRAVTAWAAFGSFDWPSLLTKDDGQYESGVFDVRGPTPRPTALARMIQALAAGGAYDHPVLDSPGWWHCDRRLIFRDEEHRDSPLPIVLSRAPAADTMTPGPETSPVVRVSCGQGAQRFAPRPILVTGANGTLGRAVALACSERQLALVTLTRDELDITDARRVAETLDRVRPWAVVNAAGYVRVDDAERDRARCRWTNTIGPAVLADRCVTRDIAFVMMSTDLVFDGAKPSAYVETDDVSPLNTYGRSKAEAERLVQEIMPSAFIVRTSAFFGEGDDHNFLARTLSALVMGKRVRAAADVCISPTYVPDLVHALLDLMIDGESGIWHLANHGSTTWAEFGRMAAREAGIPSDRLVPVPSAELQLAAARPRQTVLSSARGRLLPDLEESVRRYVRTRAWERLVRHARARDASAPEAPHLETYLSTAAPSDAD